MNGTSGGAPPKDNWEELEAALGSLAATGEMEVRENGEWIAELSAARCELRRNGGDSLVHLWSERRNLTRRILAVAEQSENRIVLEVQRFGRARTGKLELQRRETQRSTARVTREQFRASFRRMLLERFPDSEIQSSTTASDLEHSFSDVYVRGRMKDGARSWAFLAASASESAAAIEGMLTFGLLWLDWVRGRASAGPVHGLRLFVPNESGRGLHQRLAVLSGATHVEIFEFSGDGIRAAVQGERGNLEAWLVPRLETESVLAAARQEIARVRHLVPEVAEIIQPRAIPGTREVELCFRGLPFARWSPVDGVRFGLGGHDHPLTEKSEAALEKLIRQLDLHRNPLAEQTKHPLYRERPERWLEMLIGEDPSRLDAQLDHRFMYSQVPAAAGRDQRVLDLLGITRGGRLVVIEVKASENIHLLMQALDYWLRVRKHAGDLNRLGYFPGKEISPEPPLVRLVAPSLRFHPGIAIARKYILPEIQIMRIGVNEHWRRGIKVIFRQ